ncbi:MAG TPA: hypothetical protein DCX52_14100 [Massilia sp.]|nr:hypothetical protein [Massilia sp.]
MLDKPPPPPTGLAEFLPWIWLVLITLLGGIASFMRKMRDNHARVWNFTEFVGEIVISGLAGLITANLCQWQGWPMPLTYALTGIGAHMGSRALFKAETLFDTKFPAAKEPSRDHHENH